MNFELGSESFFDTVWVKGIDAKEIKKLSEKHELNFYIKNEYDCTYKLNLNLGVGIPGFSIYDNKDFEIEDFGKIPFNREITIKNTSIGKYFSVSYNLGDGSGEQTFLRQNDQDYKITYKEEGYYNISLRIISHRDISISLKICHHQ